MADLFVDEETGEVYDDELHDPTAVQPVPLSQLCAGIGLALEDALPALYWVVAEIAEFNAHRTGHAYLTLVEKGPGGELLAKMRATIWAARYRILAPLFREATGQALAAGQRVLLAVAVEFHPQYGLSLDVHAVDASFTLGELAKQRQDALQRLLAEGLLELNKRHALPPVLNRLAVISAATAAGYQDFVQQLRDAAPLQFRLTLFAATMQGDRAAASVQQALKAIQKRKTEFDAVILIRGGGGRTDLLAFDDYELAAALARLALPVLTGIGHERDESLADLVAHTRLKTPTAVAAFLIDRAWQYEALLDELARRVGQAARAAVNRARLALEAPMARLPLLVRAALAARTNRLELLEVRARAADPVRLLARGFSLTTRPDGTAIKSIADIKPGEDLITHLADGTIRSKSY